MVDEGIRRYYIEGVAPVKVDTGAFLKLAKPIRLALTQAQVPDGLTGFWVMVAMTTTEGKHEAILEWCSASLSDLVCIFIDGDHLVRYHNGSGLQEPENEFD